MIGISVNVGLNDVASNVYSAPPLLGCIKDAEAMFEIAKSSGFDMTLSKKLLGGAATFDAVKDAVSQAAQVLNPGDLFFFSFAGHGTFKVLNSAAEEPDKHDESIVLSDHFMIDNFWRKKLWPQFKPGVRIIAIADCCHSETALFSVPNGSLVHAEVESVGTAGNIVSRAGAWPGAAGVSERVQPKIPSGKPVANAERFRMITNAERQKELDQFKEFYSAQSAAPPQEINASRLFLSACKDDQKAADGEENGAFTAALLKVWDNGNFPGNYKELMVKVAATFNGTDQTPTLTQTGAPDFSSEKPFTIE